MKVLISAIACNPFLGSESHFGKTAIRCLARHHEVCVITTSRDKGDIEKATAAGLVAPGVHYYFAGKVKSWHPNRLRARLQAWGEYRDFLANQLEVAKQLHAREKFDLVHHLTLTTSRVPSPMWRLGIPFIYGPICGNEEFPFSLFPLLSPPGMAFELARKLHNVYSRWSPAVGRSVREAAHVFASTSEAEVLMAKYRGSSDGISLLSPAMYSADKIAQFTRFVPGKKTDGPLRIYMAGHVSSNKCVSLAIRALALAKQTGVKFRYHIGADGPEIPHLKQLAAKLGLTSDIHFGDNMTLENYQKELGETHVYLLPSMRETVGLTMLEAMLAGAVAIVADNCGPHLTVTEECGYKIPASTISRMARQIADVLMTIDRDRNIIIEKGRLASQRVASLYTEEYYTKTVNAVYEEVVRRGG